ncbi:MAG TPA: SGNH/GDSL hydrolase family protein [Bryobacteraceae bacterium]|nr:SGNH/GDSL hydrolase family protein [Bryobacteraceae bacterium]
MKLGLTLLLVLTSSAFSQTGREHWVATWATPEPLIRNPPRAQRPAPPPSAQNGAAPSGQAEAVRRRPNGGMSFNFRGFQNQTVRMIVHTSIGGREVRIKLASAFGSEPVTIGSAHVAVRSKDSAIVPDTDRALTFSGKPGCTLRSGMVMISDPVNLTVQGGSDLAVSLYLPGESGPPSAHGGLHTSYVSKEGDVTGAPEIADAVTTPSYYWLESVDVLAPMDTSLIVAFGDSITEGARSTLDANHTWPDDLRTRLAANKSTANFAVVNMGIGGNRVLRDGAGASALSRFDRDVLSLPGVKWVVMLESINDIGHGNTDPVTAEDLIGAFKQIIERAHMHGIKVMGCTVTPYGGASYSRPEGEAIRQAVNNWIRTGGAFDAVADFEAATRDPNNPEHERPDFDPGDHLHFTDAGYQAMANSIDLSAFTGKRSKSEK